MYLYKLVLVQGSLSSVKYMQFFVIIIASNCFLHLLITVVFCKILSPCFFSTLAQYMCLEIKHLTYTCTYFLPVLFVDTFFLSYIFLLLSYHNIFFILYKFDINKSIVCSVKSLVEFFT